MLLLLFSCCSFYCCCFAATAITIALIVVVVAAAAAVVIAVLTVLHTVFTTVAIISIIFSIAFQDRNYSAITTIKKQQDRQLIVLLFLFPFLSPCFAFFSFLVLACVGGPEMSCWS